MRDQLRALGAIGAPPRSSEIEAERNMTGSKLFDLTGRTALITGSSGGLGLAMARGLADAGAAIILNGRDEERLATAVKTFEAAGKSASAHAFDVANEAAVLSAFERFDAEGVAIDILVNNAGVQLRKPMLELSTDEWRRVVDTHLTAAFQIGREAARRMIARGKGGKIINIASLASEVARATIAPYTAAKGGIRMLTRSMAAEWARHDIQANAIGPGYIVTEMNRALIDDAKFDAWVKSRTPSGRWGQPDDLIGVAVFLASPASAYVNGQIIYVDGGLLAVM
jgi:gluconate 5-dehydrogenase